jgi:hypothetical protein
MRLILAPATQPSISLPSGRKGAPGGPSYFLGSMQLRLMTPRSDRLFGE